MTHYICTGGCKGIADNPGVCQAQDCSKNNQSLKECNCTDNKHGGAFEEENDVSQTEAEK